MTLWIARFAKSHNAHPPCWRLWHQLAELVLYQLSVGGGLCRDALVQLAKIHTDSNSTWWFRNDSNSRTPLCGLLYRRYYTEGLHVGQFLLHLLPQRIKHIARGVQDKWFCIKLELYGITVPFEGTYEGNWSGTGWETVLTCVSTCGARIAGKPKLYLTFCSTKMTCVHCLCRLTWLLLDLPPRGCSDPVHGASWWMAVGCPVPGLC